MTTASKPMTKPLSEKTRRETRRMLWREMERLEAVLRGETIDGVRLGMLGITQEWLKEGIRVRAEMLTK